MKLLKAIGKLFAFIFSIVFFGVLLSFVSILFTKNLITEKTIYKYIKEVNVFNLPANDIVDEENKYLKDVLNDELKNYGVTDNLFNTIVDEHKIEGLMSNYLSQYSNYLILDKEKPVLTNSDIYNILNTEMIESYGNRILTRKEKEDYNNLVTDIVTTVNNSIPEKEEVLVKEDIPYLTNIISFVYSEDFNYIMIAVLIIIYLLVVLCTWSFYKPFGFLGVPTIILGSILIIAYLVQMIGIKYLIPTNGTIEYFMKNFIGVAFKYILIYGSIVLGSGILMLIIHSVISKAVNKKELLQIKEKPSRRKIRNEETEVL